MRVQALAPVPALLGLVILCASSCAATGGVREQAIDHLLEMCNLLSEPGVETKGEGEVRFWYQTERLNASRQLWNPEGIRALEVRLAHTKGGNDEACLQQALREARNREAE
jgi:hypothetical protein